jgi:hypothetical protein
MVKARFSKQKTIKRERFKNVYTHIHLFNKQIIETGWCTDLEV